MNERQRAGHVITGSVFLLLLAVPALAETQNTPLSTAQIPHTPPQAMRPGQGARPVDVLQGITLTEEQKAKIDQIHQEMKSRVDVVVKDPASDETTKRAMLEGLARMERRQVFLALTPEQQAEVRKRIVASRAAEQEKNKKETALPPK